MNNIQMFLLENEKSTLTIRVLTDISHAISLYSFLVRVEFVHGEQKHFFNVLGSSVEATLMHLENEIHHAKDHISEVPLLQEPES